MIIGTKHQTKLSLAAFATGSFGVRRYLIKPLLTNELGTSPGWTRAEIKMYGLLKNEGFVIGKSPCIGSI